jgi:hypothetical protein
MNGALLDIYLPFLYNPFLRSGCVLGRTAPQAPASRRRGDFSKRLGRVNHLGDMNANMVLGGFLVMLVCQDIVAFKAIKKNLQEAMLCAMIPGYLLFYASREENRQVKPLIGWVAGLGILLMGFVR